MKKSILLVVLIFSILLNSSLMSQSKYTIKGKIKDQESGDPMIGASIQVQGTKLGDITNSKGNFIIENVSLEKDTLIVSYIGYEKKTVPFDMNGKSELYIEIKIKESSQLTKDIVVEAKADGQVAAMLERKRAENIKNIVSSEQIMQFPDLNAAESMQRIPGITLQRDQGEGRYVQLRGTPPELTNFNINGLQIPSPEGDVRFLGMDIIPADQIEFIEVTKVLTPDMDGDGIAGTVNIITKEAKGEKAIINANVAGGYNNIRASNNFQVNYSYGKKIGKFGFNFVGSYFQNNQGSDNIEYSYIKSTFFGNQDQGQDNFHVQYSEVQLRYYEITRERTALSATLDYEFNKNNKIYLRGMYNRFEDDEIRYRKIYTLDDALTFNYYLYGGIEHDVRDRLTDQQLSTLNFGGENKIGRMEISYQIGYAVATEEEPNSMEAIFENPGQAIQIRFDMSDTLRPRVTYPEGPQDAFAYDEYDLDFLEFREANIIDNNITSKIDFKIPYLFDFNNEGYVKFGAQVRLKEKTRDIIGTAYGAYRTSSNTYPGTPPELSLETVNAGFVEDDLLNAGYQMDYMPDPDLMREFYSYNEQYFIINDRDTKTVNFGEDYSANEDIFAGYGMVRHDLGNLMILAGVRYERTDIDYEGRQIITNGAFFRGMDTLTDSRSHEFILPQLQLKYTIGNDLNIRAAYTNSYARPNFRDVLPYREQDRENVRFGNPDIVYPTSLNLDLLVEKYIQADGIISGGLFFKEISDFIFYYKIFGHEGDPSIGNFSKVEFEIPLNGNRAFVYGAEIQSQFKFDFLPPIWRDFGIFANYTYTYSEAYINKRVPENEGTTIIEFGEDYLEYFGTGEEEQIQLPGQAQHTLNAALFFDNKKFYARVSLNYQDEFLTNLGAEADLDVYYANALHLDFTTNYAITPNLRVFLDALNLTNQPLMFFLGSADSRRIQQEEFYSWWARVGVKYNY